jgi:hypothetical protein
LVNVDDAFHDASDVIARMDALIMQARQNPRDHMPVSEVSAVLASIEIRLAAIEQALEDSRSRKPGL